jgi:hypothetical protein
LEKLLELVQNGATIIGAKPISPATLSGGDSIRARFDQAVSKLWGENEKPDVRHVGKGWVLCNMSLPEAIKALQLPPDVMSDDIQWLHRRTDSADWYYVCPQMGSSYQGTVSFHQQGAVELWNPVDGSIEPAMAERHGDRTLVDLDLKQGETRFVVFRRDKAQGKTPTLQPIGDIPLSNAKWTLHFPDGWGVMPQTLHSTELLPWHNLQLTDEGKAFSGTVTYTTEFTLKGKTSNQKYLLDLGRVESIAKVKINGKEVCTLWTFPYQADVTQYLKDGLNKVEIQVTNTWFNRLVYDGNQPENMRKTWTINAPHPSSPLRESGLMGPVTIHKFRVSKVASIN